MRLTLPFLCLSLLAAVAVPAAAQDPGCLQSNPCDLAVDVDALGIDPDQATFTAGDWVRLSVYNDDDVPHTVSLTGHDVTLVVPAYDIVESEPFQLARAGTYTLSDNPSGDSADVLVEAAQSFSDSSSTDSKGAPGPGLALLVVGLAAAVAVVRRR